MRKLHLTCVKLLVLICIPILVGCEEDKINIKYSEDYSSMSKIQQSTSEIGKDFTLVFDEFINSSTYIDSLDTYLDGVTRDSLKSAIDAYGHHESLRWQFDDRIIIPECNNKVELIECYDTSNGNILILNITPDDTSYEPFKLIINLDNINNELVITDITYSKGSGELNYEE